MTSNKAKAFKVAEQLAATALDAVCESHHLRWEDRDKHIAMIARALGPSGDLDVADWIEQHVTDTATQVAVSDALVAHYTDGADAGYFYGLALGLRLGRGGR